jgi:hypothetical protein
VEGSKTLLGRGEKLLSSRMSSCVRRPKMRWEDPNAILDSYPPCIGRVRVAISFQLGYRSCADESCKSAECEQPAVYAFNHRTFTPVLHPRCHGDSHSSPGEHRHPCPGILHRRPCFRRFSFLTPPRRIFPERPPRRGGVRCFDERTRTTLCKSPGSPLLGKKEGMFIREILP